MRDVLGEGCVGRGWGRFAAEMEGAGEVVEVGGIGTV